MLTIRHQEKDGHEDGCEIKRWGVEPPANGKAKLFWAQETDNSPRIEYTTGAVYVMSDGKTVAKYELAWT